MGSEDGQGHPGSLPGGKGSKNDEAISGQRSSRDRDESGTEMARWGHVQMSPGIAPWSVVAEEARLLNVSYSTDRVMFMGAEAEFTLSTIPIYVFLLT